MAEKLLVDTGPIVALVNRRDSNHAWAVAVLEGIREPLVTCDAVISEAVFLLKGHTHGGVEKLCGLLERGFLRSEFEFTARRQGVLRVLRKYDDLPASFADACLVAMAEEDSSARVFTTDADFKTYRKRDRRVIPLIFPEY